MQRAERPRIARISGPGANRKAHKKNKVKKVVGESHLRTGNIRIQNTIQIAMRI